MAQGIIEMTTKKKVLVTGACRSGTTTVTKFLRDAGLQVNHEKMGYDGTVSCMFFMDAPYYPKGGGVFSHEGDGKFSDYEFETIIHLIRHPLEAIPSQAGIYSKDHKQWVNDQKLVDISTKPNLYHAAKLWLKVNRHVGTLTKKRIRIEDLEAHWPKLRKWLDLSGHIPVVGEMNKASGVFRRDSIEWEDLYALDETMTNQIIKLTGQYGYEI